MDISVGALPDATLSAKLEFIAPKVSSGTQSNQFEIKGAIAPNSGHQLRAGYSANATIVLEARKHVLTVPESADCSREQQDRSLCGDKQDRRCSSNF